MKILCLFMLSLLGLGSSTVADRAAGKKYFFCDSKAMERNQPGKHYIIYTDVMEMDDTPAAHARLFESWNKRIKASCANSSGCTFDFNYYNTYAEAKKQVELLKKNRSADTAKYILIKL